MDSELTIRLPENLNNWIEARAVEEGITTSEIIVQWLKTYTAEIEAVESVPKKKSVKLSEFDRNRSLHHKKFKPLGKFGRKCKILWMSLASGIQIKKQLMLYN